MAEERIEIDTGTGELLCEIRDRVAVITLNRPEARNALSDHLTPALRRMIKQCGDDPNVGALLITGAGTAFCAGGDVKGMGNNSSKKEIAFEERVADLRTKQRTLTGALVAVRKPTIAALPGPAAGAGMALALACDIRIAGKSAIMSTGYARIGLTGRLRHRVAIDPAGRNIARAGTDVPVGTDRCPPLRDARSRQPRGARRRTARGRVCACEIAGRGTVDRAGPHQGQPRPRRDRRISWIRWTRRRRTWSGPRGRPTTRRRCAPSSTSANRVSWGIKGVRVPPPAP